LMLPLLAGAWAVMFTISLTNDDNRPRIAAANGQFFLIRRQAYDAVGGHEAVRDQIVEDVELMRLLKARRFKTRFMLGAQLATTRMHATYEQMLHGWGRIFSGSARRRVGRIVGAIIFLVACGFSVYPALSWGTWDAIAHHRWEWLAASGAHLTVMTLYLSILYRGSGNRARFALLFPIAGVLMIGVFAFALGRARSGKIVWRGSEFTAG